MQGQQLNIFNFILSCMTSSRHSSERGIFESETHMCNFLSVVLVIQRVIFFTKIMVYFLSFVTYLKMVLKPNGNLVLPSPAKKLLKLRQLLQMLILCVQQCNGRSHQQEFYNFADDRWLQNSHHWLQDENSSYKVDHMCTIIINFKGSTSCSI